MKISLGTWAFSFGPYADDPIPFDKVARKVAEAGYDGVEICGFAPHVSLEDYPDTESRRQVARLLADLNLGVSGYSADLSAFNPTDPENKRKYLDLFERNVELCVDIGSPLIRLDTGAAPGSIDDADYEAGTDLLAEVWQEAAELAQPAGVRMAWEFEPGFVYNKPSEAISIHEKVGHPSFRLLFDTSHAYTCGTIGARQHGDRETVKGGPQGLLKKLAGRVGHVHLIDSDGTLHGDATSTHRPFGQGKIDFAALAPDLLAIPDIEWWCVDHCFWAGSWDLIETSLAFVRNLTIPAHR